MLQRTLLIGFALLATAFAGCAEEAPTTQDAGEPAFEDLQATSTTGIIRGIVVDEAITPLIGITVTLGDGRDEIVTNEEGAFGFKDLEPGLYMLNIDGPGYQAQQTSAPVEAGDDKPPLVRVMLTPDPSELPIVSGLVFNGYLDCSFSTPAYRIAACGVTNPGGVFQDAFLAEHFDQDIAATYIQAEMIWTSNQPAGDAMMFTMENEASDGGHIADDAQGESPLVIRADYERMTNDEANPYAGYIMHRVFNMEHPATTPPVPICDIPNPIHGGTMCAKGLGATIQQKFDIYTHVFSNSVPEEDWQFSENTEPTLLPPPA